MTASIIAIAGAGGAAAKAVRKLASLRDAPDLLLALNNEISDLNLVVLAVQHAFQRQQNSGVHFPGYRAEETVVNISMTDSLKQAKQALSKLEALYTRLTKSASRESITFDKVTWLREHKRVGKAQEDLRNVRLKLIAALGVLNS